MQKALFEALDSLKHALVKDAFDALGKEVGEARDCVQVAMLVPDEVLSGEDSLCNAAGKERREIGDINNTVGAINLLNDLIYDLNLAFIYRIFIPKVGEELHYARVVVGLDWSAVGTLTASVINADGSETENDAARQFSATFEIGLQAGKVARLEFGEGIEHDTRELMIYEGVAEALHDIVGEAAQLLLGEIEGWQ